MTTLYLDNGGDFQLTPSGSLVLANGWDEVRQRIERRIFTNPQEVPVGRAPVEPEYIFDTTYGLGAKAAIGTNWNQEAINAFNSKIITGVIQDQGVNGSVLPTVQATPITAHEVEYHIQVSLLNGEQNTLTLAVS